MRAIRQRISWPTTAGVLAGLAVVLHAVLIQPWMVDDAFIFFRYAENWAHGAGPVYNPGERVDGCTALPWVAILALGNRSGVNTVAFAQLAGLAAGLAGLILLARAGRAGRGGHGALVTQWEAGAAALLTGTSGAFSAWPASGMETALYVFLSAGFALECLQAGGSRGSYGRPIRWGAWAAALAMIRPEGIVWVVVGMAAAWWPRSRSPRAPAEIRRTLTTFLGLWLPFFLVRWWYYGDPLPNTYYAKMGWTLATWARGAGYLLRFAAYAAPLWLLLGWSAARAGGRTVLRDRLPILTQLLAQVIFMVVVGGDVMPAFRFAAPVVPLLALLAASALAPLTPRVRVGALAALVMWNVAATWISPDVHARIRDDRVAEAGEAVGTWLGSIAPPGAVIATNTAGSIPYYSHLRTIDMLGLNDRHIARQVTPDMGRGVAGHEKHDGAYVFARRPEYILFGSSLGGARPAFPGDAEIAAQPGFGDTYLFEEYDLDTPTGTLTVGLYRRRDVQNRAP